MVHDIQVKGIPDQVPERIAAPCRSRLIDAVNKLLVQTHISEVQILVGTPLKPEKETNNQRKSNDYELKTEDRAKRYSSRKPLFAFEHLILPDQILEELLLSVSLIKLEKKVFDEWGLRSIEPFPRTCLNFYGASGTGKTLAAHAIASKLECQIMSVSYADVESMYHGEGPKNIEAIFLAAKRDGALLFIDEADSLLSKRLTDVKQGSEQAINSMRSQLLISLEKFEGVVIFATNLAENYDKAFETRIHSISFPLPDEKCREKIWKAHLPDRLPLADNVSIKELAAIKDICGRDIKNAVINSAMRAAYKNKNLVELDDLIKSVERVKSSRINVKNEFQELNKEEKDKIADKIKNELSSKDIAPIQSN